MSRVLIPFSDLRSGERAVRRLLAEPRDAALSVELMAIVDPLTVGKVAVFVSRERAESQSRAAAARWLAHLEAMLDSAGVRYRSSIAVGRLRTSLRDAGARERPQAGAGPARQDEGVPHQSCSALAYAARCASALAAHVNSRERECPASPRWVRRAGSSRSAESDAAIEAGSGSV